MKGWLNFIDYEQKINCTNEIVQKIIAFEQFEYIQSYQDGLIKYQVPLQECFSLQHLIVSLRLNFIKIYKGQVLIIINEILQHLMHLHQNNFSHGQLNPKNIFIHLKNLRQQKLTIYQVLFHIQKINFVNYKAIEEVYYQVDYKEDIQQIIQSIQQFLESIEGYKECIMLQSISRKIQYINQHLNLESLQQLISFFNNFIVRNLDQQTQQIIQGTYQEVRNYGTLIGIRRRSEIIIMTYLERLSVLDLNLQIDIEVNPAAVNQNEAVIFENLQFFFENQNSNTYDQEIKQIILNTQRNIIMRQFWAFFGEKLNNWNLNLNFLLQEYQSRINLELSSIVPQWYKQIKNDLAYCRNEVPKQIIDKIKEQFKFEIDVNQIAKEKITQQFIQQLSNSSQNIELFLFFESELDLIKNIIKNEVRKYYQAVLYNYCFELLWELI